MATLQTQHFCNRCQKYTLHTCVTYDVPHVAHLLATAFFCGLWLPIWILHTVVNALFDNEPFRCSQCGQAAGELTPEQRVAIITNQRAMAAVRNEQRRVAWGVRKARLADWAAAMGNACRSAWRRLSAIVWRADETLAGISGGDSFFHGFLRYLVVFLVAAIAGAVVWLAML